MGYSKIKLHGGQVCDYLYVQKSPISENEFITVDSEPNSWSEDTIMFSKFNKDLSAGDSNIMDKLEGYELRRRTGSANHTEYITTIKQNPNNYLIDYSAKNNTPYTYYLYPAVKSGDSVQTDEKYLKLLPLVSNEVVSDWGYWSLLVVDETEEENVFFLNKLFKFELNLSADEMNNNAVVSVTQNFTKYPTVQYGTSNYWSSRLTSLCGYISCPSTEYVQTPNMIEELKALTVDTRRKFLKDIDGNLWEIKITAPISISPYDSNLEKVKSVSVSWTEVADASNVSIINNPNLETISWLLTETGEAKPYINYVWDNNAVWDNALRWTAKDDMLVPKTSNMGREINNEGGEV